MEIWNREQLYEEVWEQPLVKVAGHTPHFPQPDLWLGMAQASRSMGAAAPVRVPSDRCCSGAGKVAAVSEL